MAHRHRPILHAAGLLLLVTLLLAPASGAQRTTLEFRVTGPLDGPVLGRLETVVSRRLGECGVRQSHVTVDGSIVRVVLDAPDGARARTIADALRRPDDLRVMTAVQPNDLAGSEFMGATFDADAFRDRVHRMIRKRCDEHDRSRKPGPNYTAFPLYANARDPLRPEDDSSVRCWFYPPHEWFTPAGSSRWTDDRGTFVYPEASAAHFTGREVLRVVASRYKLARAIEFDLERKPRLAVVASGVNQSVERLVVLNGRPIACLLGQIRDEWAILNIYSHLFSLPMGRGARRFLRRVEGGRLQRTLALTRITRAL